MVMENSKSKQHDKLGQSLTPFATLVLGWVWTDLMQMVPQGLANAQRKRLSGLVSLLGIYSSQRHLLNVYSVPGDAETNVMQSLWDRWVTRLLECLWFTEYRSWDGL